MPSFFVLSTVERDREGVVARQAEALRACGANLLAGHGQQVGRMFAFDALLEVDDAGRLTTSVREQLKDSAPSLVAVPAPEASRDPGAQHYVVQHLSEDRAGIVSTLAGTLTRHGASVVSLACNTYPAPATGVVLFESVIQADVPNSAAVRSLRAEFADLERHHGWEIDFRPDTRSGLRVPSAAPYPPSEGRGRLTPSGAVPAGPGKWAVLSTVSPDRAGIVAATATFLAERGASVHSQTARRVGGAFTSHCLFRADDADMGRVKADYTQALAEFRPTLVDAPSPPAARDELDLRLTVHAVDEPGILAGVAKPISAHGASIASVSFGLYPRRDVPGATPLFVAELDLLVRDFIASRYIKDALLDLEKQRGWEVDYRPARKPPDAGDFPASGGR